jgi:ADP-ribose pyrophosphatase YjhB (NUDIX family)
VTKQYDSTSVRAVIFNEGSLLVEWCPKLSIYFSVGGTTETPETLEATLERELIEEISAIDFTIGKYLGKIGHFWAKKDGTIGSCLNHFFEVHLTKSQDPSLVMAKESGRSIEWLDLKSSGASMLQPPSLKSLLLQSHDREKSNIWDVIDGV